MEYELNIEKHILKTVKINVPDDMDREERIDFVIKQLKKHSQGNDMINESIKDLGYKVTTTLVEYENEETFSDWFEVE